MQQSGSYRNQTVVTGRWQLSLKVSFREQRDTEPIRVGLPFWATWEGHTVFGEHEFSLAQHHKYEFGKYLRTLFRYLFSFAT